MTLLLGGTAVVALAVAPVDFAAFDTSFAEAAGADGSGNGHGAGKGGGRGGSGSDARGGGGGGSGGGSGGEGREERGGGMRSATPEPAAPSAQAAPGGGSADRGGPPAQAKRGKAVDTASDEDSDRPDWAGMPGGKDGAGGGRPDNAGSTKGDLFGDLWVIARDDQGVPILTPEGWVQPLDAFGNLIPLDEEGHPVDESLTMEVELGRLNVGRAPISVLERRTDEVVLLMGTATDVTTDAAGRLVFTVDGEQKTIDSPLENLAIYVALMSEGTVEGVDDLPGTAFDFMVDGAYTVEDLQASAAFLAAATDKTGEFSVDEIAYINAFLGVETEKVGDVTYADLDYSAFTYDREETFGDVWADVLVLDGGVWVPKTVNIFEEVFEDTQVTADGTLAAYTTAAEDARTVINFLHEYEVPAEDLGDVTH